MLWEDEPTITGTQNYASGVISYDCVTLKSHGLVNMVVADGLVPIRHQDICNQRGDIGQLDIRNAQAWTQETYSRRDANLSVTGGIRSCHNGNIGYQ